MVVILFRINRERIGETDYGIVIEWFWVGETKLSNSWRERSSSQFLEGEIKLSILGRRDQDSQISWISLCVYHLFSIVFVIMCLL